MGFNPTLLRASTAAAALVVFAAPVPALAQAQTWQFNLPAQSLDQTLRAVARQTHQQMTFEDAAVRGKSAPAVIGNLTIDEALQTALSESRLAASRGRSGLIIIRPGGTPQGNAVAGGPNAGSKNPTSSLGEAVEQTATTPASGSGVPEIVVVGSRSLNADIPRTRNDIQPYVVLDQETIEDSGARNIEDVLHTRLPMEDTVVPQSRQPSPSGNTSTFNLRGLGVNQTLVLVDGRRLPSVGTGGSFSQPDINSIPLSAIARVEVLPTTASGIYGGSATGGVINIVLKRDFKGFEGFGSYGISSRGDGRDRRLDFSAGDTFDNGRTSVMLAASVTETDAIAADDRDLLPRGRSIILANHPAFFLSNATPPLGATTNIRSITGAPLTLKSAFGGASLGSPITFVPIGYLGATSDNAAGLIANAGQFDFALAPTAQPSGGGRAGLTNEAKTAAGVFTIHHKVAPWLDLFASLWGSKNDSEFANNAAISSFTILASAPNNPFNQTVRVTTPAIGADSDIIVRQSMLRGIAGAIFRLPAGWSGEADYSLSRARYYSSTPGQLTPAANSAVTTGAIDVFRDLSVSGNGFAGFVQPPTVSSGVVTKLEDASFRIGGPIWRSPGGPVTLTALLEHRRESLGDQLVSINGVSTLNPAQNQMIDSVYAELRAPLISSINASPLARELELQVSGRFDSYLTNAAHSAGGVITRERERFRSTNPTIGLKYRPFSDLTFRASFGTGFVPPALQQLVPSPPVTVPGSIFGFTDPRRGGAPLTGNLTILQGGSPILQPEKSKSWSAGIILAPHWTPGLRLSVDWTRIRKTNEIANSLVAQDTINNEANLPPGSILRAPVTPGDPFGVGPIIGFNAAFQNLAQHRLEDLDIAADYDLPTMWGDLHIFGAATRILHFDIQALADGPVQDNVGLINALRWKGNAGLTWHFRRWRAGWTARYYDAYFVNLAHSIDPNLGSAEVGAQIYNDAFVEWTISKRASLQLNARNIFNKLPPFDPNAVPVGGNFYSPLGDPLGAFYSMTLRAQF